MVAGPQDLPARIAASRLQAVGPDKAGVFVERAGAHSIDRQRIEGVVLEDRHSPTWPDDPEEFLEPKTVFLMRNVVKYASREGRVKGLIGGWDSFLSDDEALFPAGKPSRTMGQTL